MPLVLMLLDVDQFKQYNDHYGHQQGDECLRQVASTLSHCLYRDFDVAARYGGEEFAIILPNTLLDHGVVVADRIIASFAQLKLPHEYSSVGDHVTVSGGMVQLQRHDSPKAFIEAADKKLYQAKEEGRNRIVY